MVNPKFVVTGRVLDRHGKPVGGAQVVMGPHDHSFALVLTTTRSDGTFRALVSAFAKFGYVTREGHGTRFFPFRDGWLRGITVPEPGRLERASADHTVRLGWVSPDGVTFWSDRLHAREQAFEELAPGRYIVEIKPDDGAVTRRPITIVAGKTTVVR